MKLVAAPEIHSMQFKFENACLGLGLNRGLLGVTDDGASYVNKNVQWLWLQYRRAN